MSCDLGALAVPGVRALKPYEPGKPEEELRRELGLERIVKLASNENPLGPAPAARAVLAEMAEHVHRYPDGSGFSLCNKLSQLLSVSPAAITLGNGSNDVLDLVARVFMGPGYNAVFSAHAFAVYALATMSVGARCQVVPANPANHPQSPFGHDLDAMRAAIDAQTRVVFIANPNNPTGTWLSAAALRKFLVQLPEHLVVVLDEAYLEYAQADDYPNSIEWLAEFPRLIITRTFSKAYGLAGLRVGYGISSAEIADLLNRVRHPFNVNSLALAAAEAALDDVDFIARSRAVNTAGLNQLSEGFKALGLRWIPSIANFISVDMARDAAPVYQALLRAGVIVRPIANYGLPQHLRVTVGTAEENEFCLRALAEQTAGAIL